MRARPDEGPAVHGAAATLSRSGSVASTDTEDPGVRAGHPVWRRCFLVSEGPVKNSSQSSGRRGARLTRREEGAFGQYSTPVNNGLTPPASGWIGGQKCEGILDPALRRGDAARPTRTLAGGPTRRAAGRACARPSQPAWLLPRRAVRWPAGRSMSTTLKTGSCAFLRGLVERGFWPPSRARTRGLRPAR